LRPNAKTIGLKTRQDRFKPYFLSLSTNYPDSSFPFNIYESEKDYCAGISVKFDDPSYPGKLFYLSDAGENPAIHGEEGCPPKADPPPAEIRHE